MHPQNTFHLRLLFRFASGLFLLVGPCVAYNLHDQRALNSQLMEEGVEVSGEVHRLDAVSSSGGVQYSKGKERCAFYARFQPPGDGLPIQECREIFDVECPSIDDVRDSPVTFLPSDPTRCRILGQSAIAADAQEGGSQAIFLWVLGLALLAFLASFLLPKPGQTADESPVEG